MRCGICRSRGCSRGVSSFTKTLRRNRSQMIYALFERNTPCDDRLAIARAIWQNDSIAIQEYVTSGTIVHIMDVQSDTRRDLFCVFCRIPVFASRMRAPRGHHAQQPWHFEHRQIGIRPGECVGYVRRPPMPHALGIKNPENHGCYISLGCETNERGAPTTWHRTRCKTIVGHSYCHLARQPEHQCVSACT